MLDTNVLSELRKPRPDANVVAFVARQPGEHLFASEVTFAEIRFGIEKVGDIAKRAELARWLERDLRPLFAGRALCVDEDVFLRWRVMVEAGRMRRHTFSQPDLFIAATAACHGLVAVSRDTSEFVEASVPCLDPWTSTYHAQGKAERLEGPVDLASLPGAKRGGR